MPPAHPSRPALPIGRPRRLDLCRFKFGEIDAQSAADGAQDLRDRLPRPLDLCRFKFGEIDAYCPLRRSGSAQLPHPPARSLPIKFGEIGA